MTSKARISRNLGQFPHQTQKTWWTLRLCKDKEIKSQIIQGCTSTRLMRKAIRSEISLDKIIKEARSLELSEFCVSALVKRYPHAEQEDFRFWDFVCLCILQKNYLWRERDCHVLVFVFLHELNILCLPALGHLVVFIIQMVIDNKSDHKRRGIGIIGPWRRN